MRLGLRRMRGRVKMSMKRMWLLVTMMPVLALAREMCGDAWWVVARIRYGVMIKMDWVVLLC